MSTPIDETSFLTGGNAVFIAELYGQYLADPASVDPSWIQFFHELADEGDAVTMDFKGTPDQKRDLKIIGAVDPDVIPAKKPNGKAAPVSEEANKQALLDTVRILMLIRNYRVRGHLLADLDPLGLAPRASHPELDYHSFGFEDSDLDRTIFTSGFLGREYATLREVVTLLLSTYCGHVGVEFMHIQDPEQKSWLQRRIENTKPSYTVPQKTNILKRMTEAEGFERFLQMKYTGTKRFGLEGGESTLVSLDSLIERGAELGLEEVVVGMAHRGRLSVLTNFMKKPYQALFSEFQGNPANPSDVQGSGDVKYHLGTSADREFGGHKVHLSLTANPSHLEVVNPVVVGKVRAKQTQKKDDNRTHVVGLLIHGDAAFAGQGVVPETLLLSQLKGYTTGGTIHLIINNQIGFTTSPQYSRSGPYCSDIAKGIQAPILHVNGDDPEAVAYVSQIAIEFRQEFQADVVIDLVCYRRHGHNESDEPAFTQPQMYKEIAKRPTTRTLYAQQLVTEGSLTQEQTDAINADFQAVLEQDFEAAKAYKPNKADWLEGQWQGLVQLSEEEEYREETTGLPLKTLKDVGLALTKVPEDFNLNPKIARQLEAKKTAIETGEGIDWATAEALAFGTLLAEGKPIRLSGQDVGRGTFSQRHAVMTDQADEKRFVPLNHVKDGQAFFEVIDSPLSEEAVLGYEYGYSLAEPNALVLWEAQFGDFANGAQVILDQFISSSESKWLRMSGLVMLLPHGMEGQGPEHSSARWERYLQMSAEDNWTIANITTPANYYHALRRQMHRNFRKPLVVFEPKSLLRHKLCVSSLDEFKQGASFQRILPETDKLVSDKKIRRIILCSGKVYYDVLEERRKRGIDDVAIVRIEQLYPWPKDTLKLQLARYPNADLVWLQEEPANMGPWMFVDRRIEFACDELKIKAKRARYVGRKAAASPATGLAKTHAAEQAQICNDALVGDVEKMLQPFQRATKLSTLSA